MAPIAFRDIGIYTGTHRNICRNKCENSLYKMSLWLFSGLPLKPAALTLGLVLSPGGLKGVRGPQEPLRSIVIRESAHILVSKCGVLKIEQMLVQRVVLWWARP